jgi:hypothetical protein
MWHMMYRRTASSTNPEYGDLVRKKSKKIKTLYYVQVVISLLGLS